jgi:curved DNA-binding protein CbpA
MNAYQILEVSRSATKKDIKSAYRKCVATWHPDKFPDDESKKIEGGLRMEKINRAFFCIGEDEERRKRYDLYGDEGVGTSALSEEQLKNNKKVPNTSSSSSSSSSNRKGTTSSKFRDEYGDFQDRNNNVRDTADSIFDDIEDFIRRDNENAKQKNSYYSDSSFGFRTERLTPDPNETGPIADLRRKLESLKSLKANKERLLAADTRDWGEVSDANEIEKRWSAIQEVKLLAEQILDVQSEIDDLRNRNSYKSPYRRTTYNEDDDDRGKDLWERLSFDDELDDNNYSSRSRINENEYEQQESSTDERVNKEMERLWSAWKKEKRRR